MSESTEDTGISLSEFKAWLEGVEEMQADDWAPSRVQWERIRAKFMQIRHESPAPRRAHSAAAPGFGPAYVPEVPSRPQPLPQGMLTGLEGRAKTPDIDSSNGYQSSLV
jgi:hypothetical protein